MTPRLDAGAGVVLRPWARGDAADLAAIASDREIWLNLRDRFPFPYTRAAAEGWLASRDADPDRGSSFAIEHRGALAGGIALHRMEDVHRLAAEVGYWLGRRFWGRGIATAALRAITAHGFDALGLERIHAFVYEWNPASARVLEKAGYALEGRLRRYVVKDGRVLDALLYARVR